MATEPLTTKHDSAKTVYFRLFDLNTPAAPLGWCVTHSAWEASPHDPKVPATEETIAGDADESLYAATVDLALLYNSATPKAFAVQAVDDLATDEIISVGEITLSSGRNVSSNADVLSSTRSTQAQVWSDGTPVAGIALNTLASHDPGETIMGETDLGTGAGFTSLAQSSVATEQRLAELDAVNLPGVLDTVAADVVNIDGWNPATTGVTAVAGDVGGKVLGGGASVISGTGARVVDGSGNAVATTANQTTILARLGAWTGSARNTLLGAFQALFRSDADATVPGDVNADLGSGVGTAVNTTDSTQAIRDALPAAGGASLTAQQVRDAMKLAPTEGSPTAGSVDDHLDLAALEATLTAMKGAGWLAATDTLEKVRDAIDGMGVVATMNARTLADAESPDYSLTEGATDNLTLLVSNNGVLVANLSSASLSIRRDGETDTILTVTPTVTNPGRVIWSFSSANWTALAVPGNPGDVTEYRLQFSVTYTTGQGGPRYTEGTLRARKAYAAV